MRVTLRPLGVDDAVALASGLGEGIEGSACLAITRPGDESPVGLVAYRVGVPEDGWLGFEVVALAPELRWLGLDAEAVRIVEEEALSRGKAKRFWAAAPKGEGLRLYFWLRLGYRPARSGELSWSQGERDDIIVMVRDPKGALWTTSFATSTTT